MSREGWAKKLVHWKHEIYSTLQHYWLGFKLLWADVRISSRLLIKLAGGRSLSRRERQQLTRTTADIFRLVPFAVFIVVPFMEFLLPVFLKLFPNMLPSTFQGKKKEQTAEDLDEFLNRVRRGAGVSNDDILGFAKLFNDELTIDNISRPRLVYMCKYMGISPMHICVICFGKDSKVKCVYPISIKLTTVIKSDDKLIQAEGVDSIVKSETLGPLCEADWTCVLMLQFRHLFWLFNQLFSRFGVSRTLNHSAALPLFSLSRALPHPLSDEAPTTGDSSSVVDTAATVALPSTVRTKPTLPFAKPCRRLGEPSPKPFGLLCFSVVFPLLRRSTAVVCLASVASVVLGEFLGCWLCFEDCLLIAAVEAALVRQAAAVCRPDSAAVDVGCEP
ncbi:hypothetical protein GQ457_09G013300 [Hibiscus cannabinus]